MAVRPLSLSLIFLVVRLCAIEALSLFFLFLVERLCCGSEALSDDLYLSCQILPRKAPKKKMELSWRLGCIEDAINRSTSA